MLPPSTLLFSDDDLNDGATVNAVSPPDDAPNYTIRQAVTSPELNGLWDGPAWRHADTLTVDRFHDRGSDHRPHCRAKALYDANALYLLFAVDDRYVRSVQTELHGLVCTDSCVECFIQPHPDSGYFNFEMNCGGTLHVSYVRGRSEENGRRVLDCTPLSPAACERVQIAHSMPDIVEPEITDPVSWWLEMVIPFDVLAEWVSPVAPTSGSAWRGNFYKCADRTSHPHWGTWAPMPGNPDFHRAECFAPLHFA